MLEDLHYRGVISRWSKRAVEWEKAVSAEDGRRSQWRLRNALRSPLIRRVSAAIRRPAGCGAPFSVWQLRV